MLQVTQIDVQSGAKTRVAQVRPGIDNFVFDDRNRMFLSHFTDGGVFDNLGIRMFRNIQESWISRNAPFRRQDFHNLDVVVA